MPSVYVCIHPFKKGENHERHDPGCWQQHYQYAHVGDGWSLGIQSVIADFVP